jgi:hypothetical protein
MRPVVNALLSTTCLLSSLRQKVEQSQQLQLISVASGPLRSAPDSSTISKSKHGNSKHKRRQSEERYVKRLRVHTAGAATSSDCLEQDDGGFQHNNAENQPPTLQQPCSSSAQGRAFPVPSEQMQAPSKQPALEARACQGGNGPVDEPRACHVSSRVAPDSAAVGHWDATYQLDPYWASNFPLQRNWKLVVPGHQGHGVQMPWYCWGAKYASLGGKMCCILHLYAAIAHTYFPSSELPRLVMILDEWKYGIQLVPPGDGDTALVTPPLWLLEKHFVQGRGWRAGAVMAALINKRKVIIYAILRRMHALPRTLADSTVHCRMGEVEAVRDVKSIGPSNDKIFKELRGGKCKEMTPTEHESKWGFGWHLGGEL